MNTEQTSKNIFTYTIDKNYDLHTFYISNTLISNNSLKFEKKLSKR